MISCHVFPVAILLLPVSYYSARFKSYFTITITLRLRLLLGALEVVSSIEVAMTNLERSKSRAKGDEG